MNALNPMEQQEIEAAAERKVALTCIEKVYACIKEGLGSIGGLDVAAGVSGCNAGDLRRSLDKDGRKLSVDQALLISARVRRYNSSLATKIGSALVYPMGLDVFPRVTMSAEQKCERYEAKLRAIGNSIGVGDQLIDDALGVQS